MPSDPRHELDPRTLEMLVCPITKTRLVFSQDKTELISIVARRAFPIVKGVPLLVEDAARVVEEDEIDRLR
ncbi:Trm112 family protein [Pelagibacterium xiamenense]|uniref:Trm112 family protein n=1 Tax=Pelagibacterium xiamenense TaxID=2901140 RepID=UPI001E44EA91|nr:Trm112 family protein [Pelagibacterium xiamenense]MCD7058407.1 Trm112 family protein [Pelagibacterium xiamenense]